MQLTKNGGRIMERLKRIVSIISLIFILLPVTLAFAEEPKAPAAQAAPAATASPAEQAPAAPPAAPAWDAKIAADTVWVLITAFLVFFMNAGFALVESGLCRSKNAVNILSKKCYSLLCYSCFFLAGRIRHYV